MLPLFAPCRLLPDFCRSRKTVTLRFAKTALVFAVAVFYSFVVFNNVTDYNSNYNSFVTS